jgi:hypothetical protein
MTAKKKIVLDNAPQVELNNYDIHKQLYARMNPLSDENLQKKLVSIGGWFSSFAQGKFFMLMCKEISYYTVFHFNEPNYTNGVEELKKTLQFRGQIIDINYVHSENAYECWIKNSLGEMEMYYLFNYDWGVVEIG